MTRKKFIWICIILSLFINCSSVYADVTPKDSREKIWDEYKDVHVQRNKVWTITFNNRVMGSEQIEDFVYVLDEQGEKVEIGLEVSEHKIIVTPIKNYIPDKSYKLIVDGELKSDSGKSLGQDIVMPFTIENNISLAAGKIKSEILLLADEIDLTEYKISKEEIHEVMDEVINNTPEIFYYDGITYYYDSSTDVIQRIEIKYMYSKDKIEKMKAELDDKIEDIIKSEITENMSDYEKELVIHDYIINNTVYDTDSLNGEGEDYVYGIYGTLIEGKAVCSGYAKTMQLFLNKFHIQNKLIFGEANGISHVWNQVKINGALYNVDVTFDDPVVNEGNKLRWNYFNVTDEVMSRNHEWDRSQSESSKGVEQNYFVKNNLIANTESEALEIIQRLMSKNLKKIDFFFKTDVNNIKSIMAKTAFIGSYRYSYDEDANIVSLELE